MRRTCMAKEWTKEMMASRRAAVADMIEEHATSSSSTTQTQRNLVCPLAPVTPKAACEKIGAGCMRSSIWPLRPSLRCRLLKLRTTEACARLGTGGRL